MGFLEPQRSPGQALGDLLSEHPRLARLSLHGNALGEKGGAKVFQGLAENARRAAPGQDHFIGDFMGIFMGIFMEYGDFIHSGG